MSWVLDSSAVLCWLLDEDGAERVDEILADGQPLVMHAVNFVEVQYRLLRQSAGILATGLSRMLAVGIEIARDVEDDLLANAARLKVAQAPIALGDTFAVALAVKHGATLVTTDRGELEKVGAAGVCAIEFLR
jgi:PIN domain nuclease of toxin-antitoxin system